MSLTLRGMTWSHPRGYDPMVATATEWQRRTGVAIDWDKRSLQDFESYPVEELARQYDLIVIDHPHVGQVTAEGCLLPLDVSERADEAEELESASVGGSYASYNWLGRQWALPIDAAAQVQAYRPDLAEGPATRWADVLDLARRGKVLVPLRPPHSLMVFFTLCANLGHPCAADPGALCDARVGQQVLEMMRELVALLDPADLACDPIAASEMLTGDDRYALIPYTYGYVSYARPGFRTNRLEFVDIPAAGAHGPVGSTLGGTGIAVSAHSVHAEAATAYAWWVAGSDPQQGLFAMSGGQPAHAAAWDNDAVNADAFDFYRNTRATLDGAWTRPRHNGYMRFQAAASERLHVGLAASEPAGTILRDMQKLFGESL